MFKRIKDYLRILFDPTMFKYHQNFMENTSFNPCNHYHYYEDSFKSDIVIVFDKDCDECMCTMDNNKYFSSDKVIIELYNTISRIKNAGLFKNKIVIAFYVDPCRYSSYDEFYDKVLKKLSNLFIADFMILYGLKKHKIRVLKCADNIGVGLNNNPIYTKEFNCIIKVV